MQPCQHQHQHQHQRQTISRSATYLSLSWIVYASLGWWAIQCQSVSLPLPTSVYSAVVSGSYGNLNFSYHYHEYADTPMQLSRYQERYYTQFTTEYVDRSRDLYCLQDERQPDCTCYTLSVVDQSRWTSNAASLLVNLSIANAPFISSGLTQSVRSQPSVRFTASLSYISANVSPMYSMLDQFLLKAYSTAGVDTSSSYSVNATIDVYYAADSNGTLLMVDDGAAPVRFSITGTRTDVHGPRELNILYDFMQWAHLDVSKAGQLMENWDYYACIQDGDSVPPPSIPHSTSLGAVNMSLPLNDWRSGRVILELTATNSNLPVSLPWQTDAMLQLDIHAEVHNMLTDPGANKFNSWIYRYSSGDYQFENGVVYAITTIDAVVDDVQSNNCNKANIDSTNLSPIQWLNAGSLLTMLTMPSFFSGVQYNGRHIVRGIAADSWSIDKTVTDPNGVFYNFTLQVYAIASGWLNMGSFSDTNPAARQLLRLAYAGTRSSGDSYTLQMDFFVQHLIEDWTPYLSSFTPTDWTCEPISTSSSSSSSTTLIVSIVGGVVGGISLLAAGYRYRQQGSSLLAAIAGSVRSAGDGNANAGHRVNGSGGGTGNGGGGGGAPSQFHRLQR